MANIIVKNYEHYNRALGKHITSKAHYEKEMRKQGMVSFKEGKKLAEEYKRNHTRKYDRPSPEAEKFIREIGMKHSDGNGKIKLSDRQIDKMKEMGVAFDPKFKPSDTKGGFE